jgi:hypothetical protein
MAVHDLGEGVRLWTRDEWEARDPTDPMAENNTLREAFIHHTTNAAAEWVDNLTEQKAAMRATQDFHQLVRGWSDIGYAFVVFQPYGGLDNARVFQGRLTRWAPAAQANHNTGTVPICVFGNFQRDDEVKPETVTAVCRVIKWVERNHDGTLVSVGGHRDVGQTSCPGDALYAKVPEIARRTGLRRY